MIRAVVLFFFAMPGTLNGFSTPRGRSIGKVRRNRPAMLRKDDKITPGEDDKVKLPTKLNLDSDKGKENVPIRIPIPSSVQRVLETIYYIWSYVVIALGIALSFGLLLNIFGYGYQLTEDGLRIDSIDQFRTENQFRIEVINSMKESRKGINVDPN
jgi:hypothetical protein